MNRLERLIISANASIFQRIDPSTNIKVFIPKSEEEVRSAIKFAREQDLDITSKGGGSGLSGACTGGSRKKVVISSMRLKTIHSVNAQDGFAIVGSGVTPDELNSYLQNNKITSRFCVTPSSRDIATLGGMLSTDGGGNDAWLAGTMQENVLAVELFNYSGHKIVIERVGGSNEITCEEDKELERKLTDLNFGIADLASAHGVLGFITKIKVRIKPTTSNQKNSFAVIKAQNLENFGKILHHMILEKIPVIYSEAIVESYHPDITKQTTPPVYILDYPKKIHSTVKKICGEFGGKFHPVDKPEFERIQTIRINIAKRNPPKGLQIGLFEGYGISGDNLLQFDKVISRINNTLKKHNFNPFLKYGHAPSVWYDSDRREQGIIMHSREVRPDVLTKEMIFNVIVELVDLCESLSVTPKPEHKWPYSKETKKHKRLSELCSVLGRKFNPFILECSLEELAELVL